MSALATISEKIDSMNDTIGRGVAWLVLLMVLIQFFVVIFRYVFSISFIQMQEAIWYLHGVIFMLGASYTLLNDGHVRVDVFYRDASPKNRARVDFWGGVLYLLPFCILVFYLSFGLVVNSWKVLEGSTETNGIHAVYLLKTVIWVFAVLMFLQGFSLVAKAWLYINGKGTHYDEDNADEYLSEDYQKEIKNSETSS